MNSFYNTKTQTTPMNNTILNLSHQEALDFLMDKKQYIGFELPEYFDFNPILKFVKDTIAETPYKECLHSEKIVGECAGVNHEILLNKDGKYAVRPLTLCNPYLYYFLAREICSESNWSAITDCFKKYEVENIKNCAIPIVMNNTEQFYRANTILNWWQNIEQRSLELSLEYRYMFVTDITNCYGTIDPRTIDWALARKNTKYQTSNNKEIAANIITYLRDMQQGRNIGIPQGSTLFDVIAEIILGYSDLLLSEAIQRSGINCKYEILRYRDDYRVFCNNKGELEKISYILQEVLEHLNFRMNSQKTKISDSIIIDAIKPDKLAYIYNTPIIRGYSINHKKEIDNGVFLVNRENVVISDFASLQKHLLYILMFSREHHNGGQIKTLLSDFDKELKRKINYYDKEYGSCFICKSTIESAKNDDSIERSTNNILGQLRISHSRIGNRLGNIKAMVAILVQIAAENISSSHYSLRIISRLIDNIKNSEIEIELIERVWEKLNKLPNSNYSKIWLQNISYKYDKDSNICKYDLPLCQLAIGNNVELWNNSWLLNSLTQNLPYQDICPTDSLPTESSVIVFSETRDIYNMIEDSESEYEPTEY